jgi:hypothetical protein
MEQVVIPDVSALHVRSTDSLRSVMRSISDAAKQGLPGGIALVVSANGLLEGSSPMATCAGGSSMESRSTTASVA